MNEINQAIEALERCIAEPEAKPWHDINIALAALRSLRPATHGEIYDAWGQTKLPITMDPRPFFEAGFRAGEQFARRRLLGD